MRTLPYQLLAYAESVDQTLDNLAAVSHPLLTTSGDDIEVPVIEKTGYNRIWGAYWLAANAALGAIQANSFFGKYGEDGRVRFLPVDANAEPLSRAPFHDLRNMTIGLAPDDQINALIQNDGAGSAENAFAALFVGAQPPQPVSPQGYVPVRLTGTATGVARDWTTEFTPSLTTALPPGRYSCIHVRAQGATSVFWEVNARDQQWRPSGLALDADSDILPHPFRVPGTLGELFQFDDNQIPPMRLLATDTSAQSPELIWYVRRIGNRTGRGR